MVEPLSSNIRRSSNNIKSLHAFNKDSIEILHHPELGPKFYIYGLCTCGLAFLGIGETEEEGRKELYQKWSRHQVESQLIQREKEEVKPRPPPDSRPAVKLKVHEVIPPKPPQSTFRAVKRRFGLFSKRRNPC